MSWLQDAGAVVGLVGGLAGAIGGYVSVLVYKDQRKQQRAIDDLAHIPREMEPLLDEIIDLSWSIEKETADPAMVALDMNLLRQRWEPLAHQAVAAMRGDGMDFSRLGYLMLSFGRGYDTDGIRWGDEPPQTRGEQRATAKEVTDAATDLRIRLRTGQRMPERPWDGSDMPPQSIGRRRGLRRLIRRKA